MTEADAAPQNVQVVGKLSSLDRLLPIWIFVAMALGIMLGAIFPAIKTAFNALSIGTVSLPIAIGLLWMMYPVLARVKYEELGKVTKTWKHFGWALLLIWGLAPLTMFILAWVFLPDLPQYRTGLTIVGVAPCIAMVLIWNMLAGGDAEYCAVLVAVNSLLQIVLFSPLAYLYLRVVPQWLGFQGSAVNISMADIAKSVFIFLGTPLAAGIITRLVLRNRKGADWYDHQLMPKLGPTALFGLLFTIVVMFSMQGDKILARPLDVVRIAIPLVLYFLSMFGVTFLISWRRKLPYPLAISQSFTVGSNNFELAIAVAVATFGIASPEALATVIGPLIEVPVLVSLVYVSLWLKKVFFDSDGRANPVAFRPL